MYSGKKAQHDFPKMRGGDQRPFGTFPKIHPFWKRRPSLTNIFDIIKAIMKTEDDKTDGHAGPAPVCRH